MWDTIKKIISPLAPVIGGMLGGPGGAIAAEVLKNKLLGNSGASDNALLEAVQQITPEKALAIKQAENELMLELEKVYAADRDSARTMQIQTKSNVPAVLTIILTLMVAYTFSLLCFVDIDNDVKHALEIFSTQILVAWLTAIAYWFGTTHGSQVKTALLGK